MNHHAYKICDIDAKNEASLTTNVKLLREVGPKCNNPFEGDNERSEWNGTAVLKGSYMGSMVKAAASSTTWKRNATLY